MGYNFHSKTEIGSRPLSSPNPYHFQLQKNISKTLKPIGDGIPSRRMHMTIGIGPNPNYNFECPSLHDRLTGRSLSEKIPQSPLSRKLIFQEPDFLQQRQDITKILAVISKVLPGQETPFVSISQDQQSNNKGWGPHGLILRSTSNSLSEQLEKINQGTSKNIEEQPITTAFSEPQSDGPINAVPDHKSPLLQPSLEEYMYNSETYPIDFCQAYRNQVDSGGSRPHEEVAETSDSQEEDTGVSSNSRIESEPVSQQSLIENSKPGRIEITKCGPTLKHTAHGTTDSGKSNGTSQTHSEQGKKTVLGKRKNGSNNGSEELEGDEEDDDDEEEDDEEDDERPSSNHDGKRTRTAKSNLRCPFLEHKSIIGSDHINDTCETLHKSWGNLRTHVRRTHIRGIQCITCWDRMGTEGCLTRHQIGTSKSARKANCTAKQGDNIPALLQKLDTEVRNSKTSDDLVKILFPKGIQDYCRYNYVFVSKKQSQVPKMAYPYNSQFIREKSRYTGPGISGFGSPGSINPGFINSSPTPNQINTLRSRERLLRDGEVQMQERERLVREREANVEEREKIVFELEQEPVQNDAHVQLQQRVSTSGRSTHNETPMEIQYQAHDMDPNQCIGMMQAAALGISRQSTFTKIKRDIENSSQTQQPSFSDDKTHYYYPSTTLHSDSGTSSESGLGFLDPDNIDSIGRHDQFGTCDSQPDTLSCGLNLDDFPTNLSVPQYLYALTDQISPSHSARATIQHDNIPSATSFFTPYPYHSNR